MGIKEESSVDDMRMTGTEASRGVKADRPRHGTRAQRQADRGTRQRGEGEDEDVGGAAAAAATAAATTRRQPARQARQKRPYKESHYDWSTSSSENEEDCPRSRSPIKSRRVVHNRGSANRGGRAAATSAAAPPRVPPQPRSPPPSSRDSFSDQGDGGAPRERLLMREWLVRQLDSGTMGDVLRWENASKTQFRMAWVHGSRQQWKLGFAQLFQEWAIHSGKFDVHQQDTKRWKANFRCALNSLRDVKEEKDLSRKRGEDAFKIYTLLPPKRSTTRRGGAETIAKTKQPVRVKTESSSEKVELPLYCPTKTEDIHSEPWSFISADASVDSPDQLLSESHTTDHEYAKARDIYGLIPEVVEAADDSVRQMVWEDMTGLPKTNSYGTSLGTMFYSVDGTARGSSSPSTSSDSTSAPSDAEITDIISDMMDTHEMQLNQSGNSDVFYNSFAQTDTTPSSYATYISPPCTPQDSDSGTIQWNTDSEIVVSSDSFLKQLGMDAI